MGHRKFRMVARKNAEKKHEKSAQLSPLVVSFSKLKLPAHCLTHGHSHPPLMKPVGSLFSAHLIHLEILLWKDHHPPILLCTDQCS